MNAGINNIFDESPPLSSSGRHWPRQRQHLPAGVRCPRSVHLHRPDARSSKKSLRKRSPSDGGLRPAVFFGSSPISGVHEAGARSSLPTCYCHTSRRQEGDRGPDASYSPALGRWEGYEVTEDRSEPRSGRSRYVIRLEPVHGSERCCSRCGRLTPAIHDLGERRIRSLPVFEHWEDPRVPRVRLDRACEICYEGRGHKVVRSAGRLLLKNFEPLRRGENV